MSDSILIVDDEPEVRALLRTGLEAEGFTVLEAGNGAEAEAQLAAQQISLLTLDLKLGGEDGLKLARELRAKRNTPIIMITGKGDPIDRVVGLELGADDYIAKPFHLREVLARVRAVLRRSRETTRAEPDRAELSQPPIRFDRWVLDRDKRELRDVEGRPCILTTAEFSLLDIFVRHANRVLTRDQIMDLLKGHEWSPLDRSIDNLVARLRRKIEPADASPSLIKTVRGLGYIFTASVEPVALAK